MAYFDHAATTRISEKALEAMRDTARRFVGNPSSLHTPGVDALKRLNGLRGDIAKLLGANRREIVFTGSGTEANNHAWQGVFKAVDGGRFITTRIEHHATEMTAHALKRLGADVVFLDVDEQGLLDPAALKDALTDDTRLVSIIHANNEIGTVQSLPDIRSVLEDHPALLHLDMVQTPLHMPVDAKETGADLISFSAHKFHGPRGVGCLYVREGVEMEPLIHGGGQEDRRRAGTHNLPAIAGFAVALQEAYDNHAAHTTHVAALAKRLLDKLTDAGLDFRLNGPPLDGRRLQSVLNLGFAEAEAMSLSYALNTDGIYVSLGSACDSQNIEPSHVLQAINVPKRYRNGSLRFSFGDENTNADIDHAVDVLTNILKE